MFVQRLLAQNPAIFSRISTHPFNQLLSAGTLPRKSFKFFLEQDALYLRDFSNALRVLSHRVSDRTYAAQFRYLADDMMSAEMNINTTYLNGVTPRTFFSQPKRQPIQKIPAIQYYTNHLLSSAQKAPIAEAVLSCVPCFLIYEELGRQMNACKQPNNPYQRWIDSYSSKQFVDSTNFIVQAANDLVEMTSCSTQRARMNSAFVRSSQCEIMFFNAVPIENDTIGLLKETQGLRMN